MATNEKGYATSEVEAILKSICSEMVALLLFASFIGFFSGFLAGRLYQIDLAQSSAKAEGE